MKRILSCFLVFISLLIYNCKNQSNIRKNNDFENYIKNIPTVDLPFSTTCSSCCNTIKIGIDTVLIKKFNPDNLDLVGKIIEKKKFVAIFYAGQADGFVPILITYDRCGNIISKRQFMQDYCGQTVNFYSSHYLNIDKHLQIKVIDTSLVFKMDTVNYKIIDTLERDIKHTRFTIKEDGVIIRE